VPAEPELESLRARLDARRRAALAAGRAREAGLPPRLLHQTSHLIVPASDGERIAKAAAGLAHAPRLLARLGLGAADVAAAIDVAPALVEEALARGAPPPVLVVDGEDATARDPAVQARARAAAVEALCALGPAAPPVALYMPCGLELEACARDLVDVVAPVLARGGRLDGLVWPKARHEDDVRFVGDALLELERAAGAPVGAVRVVLMVEAGAAVLRLPRLVEAAGRRLLALVLGLADHAADIGLPAARMDHPVADAARAAMVHAAAAAGVPAIDAMTFEFPVADPALDAAANRARVLGALAACARDARRGAELGLAGKWVGHPLQLLVNEVVRRALLGDVAALVEEARAYAAAEASGRGAIAWRGRMLDRATDRHVRARLRAARGLGLVADDVARDLDLD
jgi:citrate lyase beta subunit